MNPLDRIINHPLYQEYVDNIKEDEVNRPFCKHDMTHFLDVARIAYILSLEDGVAIDKTLLYATALCHDIGRFKEYREGIGHEIASTSLSYDILLDAGFDEDSITYIQDAIIHHRDASIREEKTLRGYIYRADKASRPCHTCSIERSCNWETRKKNLSLTY